MQGAIDLLESERGIFCILLIIAVTLLAALRIITGADWIDFAKWIAITLVASKTVTTALDQVKRGPAPEKPADGR
jgi:hypothetical protein